MKLLIDEEAAKLVNEDEIKHAARSPTPSRTASSSSTRSTRSPRAREAQGADVSRQGVQRDLLPLVEGTTVNTKYGMVQDRPHPVHRQRRLPPGQAERPDPRAAGALPDPRRAAVAVGRRLRGILTQTHASLVKQYQALLATEGVTLEFAPDGITRLAQIAFDVNERTENIGARRLSTVMERLLDEVSFDAPNRGGQTVRIDAAAVDAKLADLAQERGPVALHPLSRQRPRTPARSGPPSSPSWR